MLRRLITAIVAELHQASIVDALNRTHDLAARLAAEQAISGELRATLAQSRANFDWLAARVNELNLERAELYRRIGVNVPVAEVVRQTVGLVGADDNYAPGAGAKRADISDLMAKARELQDEARRPVAPGADLPGVGHDLSFEDMGDAQAAGAGVMHDASGNVVYSR